MVCQLLVRGAAPASSASGTICVDVGSLDQSVGQLMACIEARTGLPSQSQGLIFGGRQLDAERALCSYGISAGSTVHVVFRLLGGKGGFGALLRGQGRDGKLTTNFEAMRDLQGRRIRHQVAEQKLAEWRAQAPERELEKVALKHIREEARKARKAAAEEVDVHAIREAQEEAITRTQQAVQDALASTSTAPAGAGTSAAKASPPSSSAAPAGAGASSSAAGGSGAAAGAKRKQAEPGSTAAARVAPAPKRSKMLAALEDVSDESDDDEEEDA